MQDLTQLMTYQPLSTLLAGRNILVTGAGDGIGRAAAISYAQHGATVILLGRTVSKLEAVYDEIESSGGPRPAIMPLDLAIASSQDYDHLAGEIAATIGPLHGLLNNAASLGEMKPLAQYSSETFEQIIKVNLVSNFLLSKALLPVLEQADDASIIFTSSGVGRKGRAYWGAYAVSKFGVEGLMQTWADELGDISNIRINSLNPGATRTAMRQQAYPAEAPTSNPEAQSIMGAYLFLMGPESLAINGRQLNAQPQ